MRRLPSTLLFAFLLLFPIPTFAQIVPDNTLGSESSRTVSDTINNLPSDRIEGGATRGVNLFHSFREFNVSEGRGAYFANPNGIANIFSRVTGGNPSNILGVLGVQGNANLFLLNPKGIVFGPNARLDLRGSFIGSTASGVLFNNGFEFSSNNPGGVPLLAINIPVGLRFRENPGAIANQSRVTQVIQGKETPVGLAVDPGQTLALVGGNLTFNNGFASALSGNILLGSVASRGVVSFNISPVGLGLDYTNVANFGNIDLSGLSAVTASGPGGGAIAIRGENVTLRDRASLVSDTFGSINGRDITIQAQQLRLFNRSFIAASTFGEGAGGNLIVNATDKIELTGVDFAEFQRNAFPPLEESTSIPERLSGFYAGTFASGAGGNIAINTRQLNLVGSVLIDSPAYSLGQAGNINIRATESSVINASAIKSNTFGAGNAGTLTFEAGRLIVQNGGLISAATFGSGRGGDIRIATTESLVVSTSRADSVLRTAISSNSAGSTGDSGNIDINTASLLIEKGAIITAGSGIIFGGNVIPSFGKGGNVTINASESVTVSDFGQQQGLTPEVRAQIATGTISGSPAGDITINTRRLIVSRGAQIGASTVASGRGGSVTINAKESVKLTGKSPISEEKNQIATASGDAALVSQIPLDPTGPAGNLTIITSKLTVENGEISVTSLATGQAGVINILANTILLNHQGSINGSTNEGSGGDINIQARDIQLRDRSRISTDAGSSDGGNININSDILATLPNENSDITANARTARGGQVTVNVPNIFGFTAVTREQARGSLRLSDTQFAALQVNPTSLLPTSDIAAISQQAGPALQGAVTFSTTGVNPAQGLVALPQNVVDPAALIAANPCTQGAGSEFSITGKGGVPSNPNDVLSSDSAQLNWVEPAADGRQKAEGRRAEIEIQQKEVIAAQGWVMDDKGQVTLVSYNSGVDVSTRNSQSTGVCVPRR